MTDQPGPLRPTQLWKQLSSERRLKAADAFWRDENAETEQLEAITTIAQKMKFRPKTVLSLSNEKRAKYLATLAPISELVAARLLVAYHLEYQRPMMASFLDALGIAHDDGLIADDQVKTPEPPALHAAAKTIAASYPAEDVALYLSTLRWQDPDTWGALADAPEAQGATTT
jgi:hypothetical protein